MPLDPIIPGRGDRLPVRESVKSVDPGDGSGSGRNLKIPLRDIAADSLFANFDCFHLHGGMDLAMNPLLDFWETLGLPGRTRPTRHWLSRSFVSSFVGFEPSPRDLAAFKSVWICPREYAVQALDRLRAISGLDLLGRRYWSANIAEVVHADVDIDFRPVTIRVLAFGVSTTDATWAFTGRGFLVKTDPDPAVAAVGAAVLASSHTPFRSVEPEDPFRGLPRIRFDD